MRLNKYLASKGYASRRGADKLVEEGAVMVNGKVATMGMQVEEGVDSVEVSANVLEKKEQEKKYFVLYKPTGYVTSTHRTEEEGKIFLDLFPKKILEDTRLFPVGRLDKESEGLLLVTNDGDLTFKLTHPSFEHEKEYEVEIFNPLTEEMVQRLGEPFYMLGQKTTAAPVQKIDRASFQIILKEGKNRQIRRMVRSIGSGVKILKRIRMGNYSLPSDMQPGEIRELSKDEIKNYFGDSSSSLRGGTTKQSQELTRLPRSLSLPGNDKKKKRICFPLK